MLDYIILIRALVSFGFLFVLARLIGKKQLAQFSFFDYVVGITIGNFAANMVLEPEINIVDGIVVVTVWGVLPVFLSLLSRKYSAFRKIFEGSPTVIIENGKLKPEALVKENLSVENVMLLLRKSGNFDLRQVELAVMENSGDLSVVTKMKASTLTVEDMDLFAESRDKPRFLIVEGHVLEENLRSLERSREWLEAEIRKQGAASIKEVLVAQMQADGTLDVRTEGNSSHKAG